MIRIGILIFPNVQALDFCGPLDVFSGDSRCQVILIWKSLDPIQTNSKMTVFPQATIHDSSTYDVIVIPGGAGVNALLLDNEIIDWIFDQSKTVRFLTSVCTGSLVLGAAGLLKGKKASCHWGSIDLLAAFGAIPTHERVVRDGSVITAGGVTSGIDFGLTVLSELFDEMSAQTVQLYLEYAPQPPFNAGHPSSAPQEVFESCQRLREAARSKRVELVDRCVAENIDRFT
jgi:cyclohexyl-isocyanide hydratase